MTMSPIRRTELRGSMVFSKRNLGKHADSFSPTPRYGFENIHPLKSALWWCCGRRLGKGHPVVSNDRGRVAKPKENDSFGGHVLDDLAFWRYLLSISPTPLKTGQ